MNKKNVGETDRIYTIYTLEAGKIRILGKGVRKPNAKLAGSLEPITLAEIFVAKSKGMGKITGAIPLENFSKIKSDFDALEKVYDAFVIFSKIIADQEKDKEVYEIFLSFLFGLEKISGEENKAKMEVSTLGFFFKLLFQMGYGLEVNNCVHCGKKLEPDNNLFSASRGGILCRDCQSFENKRIKISPESIKLIRIFLKNKIGSLTKLQVSQKDLNNLKVVVQESFNWI